MNPAHEEVFFFPTIRSTQLRPRGRRVLARAEQPPEQKTTIWTPHHKEKEGRALGFVVYGRAVSVGEGDYEPVWVTDERTGESVREGQQAGARSRRIKVWARGTQGDEVQERVDPRKLVFVPTQVRAGERIMWAHGWGPRVELADGAYFLIHEDGVLGSWTPDHEHCWHLSEPEDGVYDYAHTRARCCSCPETRLLETHLPACGPEFGPRLAEAIIGRDPTRVEVFDTGPAPSEEAPSYVVNEGEDDGR